MCSGLYKKIGDNLVCQVGFTKNIYWIVQLDTGRGSMQRKVGIFILLMLLIILFSPFLQAGCYDWMDHYFFRVEINRNKPPYTPSCPCGPVIGKRNVYCYGFNCCSNDPEGDKIHYIWDFGDYCGVGTISFGCGCKCYLNHCWDYCGLYAIRVMAMDEHYAYSGWSVPHPILILN